MKETVISVKNLSKSYRMYNSPAEKFKELMHPFKKHYHKEFWALRDISFEIRRGETIGIIGKNGSGKSTLLKLLTSIIPPTSGECHVNGRISALLELGTGFNMEYTGIENVYFSGTLMGYSKKDMDKRLDIITSFADIGEFIYQPIKTYSSGMLMRLAFAVAINVEPELLVLDEVLAVGDISFQNKCLQAISRLVEAEDTTILFVSHDLHAMRLLCDRCILLDKGQLIMDGLPVKVTEHYSNVFSPKPTVEVDFVKLRILDREGIIVDNVETKGDYCVSIELQNIVINEGLLLAFSFVNLQNKFSYRVETDRFKHVKGDIHYKRLTAHFGELNLPKGNYTIRFAVSDGAYLSRKYYAEETIAFMVTDSAVASKFLRCEWEEEFSESKKVGLIGWWGGKNEGDKCLLDNLKEAFRDGFNLQPIETPFDADPVTIAMLNGLDFIIVGGGGLFTASPPRPLDTFTEWKDQLKTPFGLLGVGVQEISPRYRDVISEIARRSVFFNVRDTGSFESVGPLSPKVTKAPDISFLHPRKINMKKDANAVGVNLRIWNFDEKRTYDNKAWCEAVNALPGEKETVPLSFLEGVMDSDAMKRIKGKHNEIFDIKIYENIHVMIGMRLHSLVFAVQNAIPIIGIAYTLKVRRFFEEVGLQDYCLGLEEYGRLGEVFASAVKNRGNISEALRRYTAQSNASITAEVERVKNIIRNI